MKPSRISARKRRSFEAEPAHDAEIDRDEAALGVDEEVPGMHVGVEEAVPDRVAQEGLDDRAAERGPVVAGGLDRREVAEADAVDPLRREHVAGGQVPFGPRHPEAGIVPGVLGELRQGRRLEPQVHLDRDRAREGLDDLLGAQPARLRREALEQARGRPHRLEVAGEALAHARAAPP